LISRYNFRTPRARRRGKGREKGKGGRHLGDEHELQVIDDPVDRLEVHDEGDDLHRSAALGAKNWINLINLTDHGRPAII